MRRLIFTLTLTFALLPGAAALASGSAVIRDCTDDGRLQGHYTQRDLRDALSSIPSDVDEYTNCRDVIRRAAFNGAGGAGGGSTGGGGGASSGGGAPGGEFGGFGDGGGGSSAAGQDPLSGASPAERKAIDAVRLGKAGPLRFSDGSLIRPGALTRHAGTDVPAPLLVAVVLLALALVAAAVPAFRARVLARRHA